MQKRQITLRFWGVVVISILSFSGRVQGENLLSSRVVPTLVSPSPILVIESERWPVELELSWVSVSKGSEGEDRPFGWKTPQAHLTVQNSQVLIPRTHTGPVQWVYTGSPHLSPPPVLELRCDYCRVSLKGFPTEVRIRGKRLDVTASQVNKLRVYGLSVRIQEATAIHVLGIETHRLEIRDGILVGGQLEISSAKVCKVIRSRLEISETAALNCESLEWTGSAGVFKTLQLKAGRASFLADHFQSHQFKVHAEHVFASFGPWVEISEWSGRIAWARILYVEGLESLKQLTGQGPNFQFVHYRMEERSQDTGTFPPPVLVPSPPGSVSQSFQLIVDRGYLAQTSSLKR